MILEAIEYALTPAPRWARQAGLLREAIALRARANRCAEAWRPHLQTSRAAILRAAADLPRYELATILGSGPCLDVPLDDLLLRFHKIVLVDAVHPISIRMRKPANVRLVTADLSRLAPKGEMAGGSHEEEEQSDLVVSANVLTQLPLFPTGSEDGQTAMHRHLEGLLSYKGRKVLISDMVRRYTDRSGQVTKVSLLDGLGLPKPLDSWRWNVVPPGESSDGVTVETDVGCWVWDGKVEL